MKCGLMYGIRFRHSEDREASIGCLNSNYIGCLQFKCSKNYRPAERESAAKLLFKKSSMNTCSLLNRTAKSGQLLQEVASLARRRH
jgi:hypothetical protein